MNKRMHVAVVLAAMSVGSVASAQYRVGDDGRALDANNRIGSGGFNDRQDLPHNVATGNQIVTGNVAGNKQFRGAITYRDPNDFRGPMSTQSMDRFLRKSEGVDYRDRSTGQAPQVFYGNRAIGGQPREDLQQEHGTGIYVPRPEQSRVQGDVRLGIPQSGQTVWLPQPGELVLPGPIDPTTSRQTLLTASPVYGIRQWNTQDEADQQFLTKYTSIGQGLRTSQLSDADVAKAQAELAQVTGAVGEANKAEAAAITGTGLQGADLGSRTPEVALSNTVKPVEPGVRQRFMLPEPEKQSEQLAALKHRRQQIDEKRLSDAEAARLYNAELQARMAAEKQAQEQARAGVPAAAPKPVEPPAVIAPPKEKQERPAPIKIQSLAEGVKAKGLHDLLVTAEDRMKEGKFSSALDAYDNAEQVAPNNPLITLGRAHAELGASYYGRAEGDLRMAVQAEPALLLAQYDLQTMLGETRVQFLQRDLRDIAQREKNQARPLLLLAYISYNTGNESRALVYLNQAGQLAPEDPLIPLLRKNWNLPTE